MVRFNLFWDVKVAGVAGICKFSCRLIRMHTPQSRSRDFCCRKVWWMRRKVLIMKYRNQQLIKPNFPVRFWRMETELISEVPYFGTRRPFYHERLWRRKLSTRPLQICLHGVSTTGCRSSFKKQAILWLGALFFPFVVLNSLRTDAPPFWCKRKCCIELIGMMSDRK